MDIKNTETKLDQADSFLTKLKMLLKKHWGILLLLGAGYCVYAFIGLVGEEMENPTVDPIETVEPYIIETYEEYDEVYGDTLIINVWSDGIETVE